MTLRRSSQARNDIRLFCYSAILVFLTASLVHAGVGGGPFVSGALRQTAENEGITDVVRLADGRVAICGWTGQTEAWDGVTGGYGQTHFGSKDAFVAILNKNLDSVKAFTFFGGLQDDSATSIAVDANGTIIVVGTTTSTALPTTTGAFAPLYSQGTDGFVFGFSADLSAIRYGSYIPGSKDELPVDVEVDELNTIYICGATNSPSGFPTANGFDRVFDGGRDAFLMRLSENAGSMLYSTYFGGDANDIFNDLAVDPSGSVVLAGTTNSAGYPTYPTVDPRWWWYSKDRPYDWSYNGGNSDAVLTIFSRDGARVIVSTFFGGTGDDEGNAVVFGADDVTLIGTTTSTDLPTIGGQQATPRGGTDLFLANFNPTGRTLMGSTYFGGGGNDVVKGADRHALGEIAVWGTTTSNDFPKHGQAGRGDLAGGRDIFLSIMGVGSVSTTTLFGGSADDDVLNAAMEPDGGIIFVGPTRSSRLELDGISLVHNGPAGSIDAMVVRYAFGAIDLVTPRGGERFCVGQAVTVNWTTTEMSPDDLYVVEWSVVGGSSSAGVWSVVGGPMKGRSYTWTPSAAVAGSSLFVRVRSLRHHASVTEQSVRIDPQITIVQQPVVATTVCPDGTITLHVQASAPDARYQWRRNGAPISGATLDSLVIRGDATPAAGQYDVVLTASCGLTVTSSTSIVSLGQSTRIASHPHDTTIQAGAPLRLSVEATATDVKYQWVHNGADLPGQTTSVLLIPSAAAQHAGLYHCRVSGSCGVLESDQAVVTIQGISSVSDILAPLAPVASAFPNPATDHLTIVSDRAISHVEIIDILGRPLTSIGNE
ncbi:MAG: hypothetical protein EHM43_02870, partial [Ignavibacteriae bacterium]